MSATSLIRSATCSPCSRKQLGGLLGAMKSWIVKQCTGRPPPVKVVVVQHDSSSSTSARSRRRVVPQHEVAQLRECQADRLEAVSMTPQTLLQGRFIRPSTYCIIQGSYASPKVRRDPECMGRRRTKQASTLRDLHAKSAHTYVMTAPQAAAPLCLHLQRPAALQ
ncbi:hypothetical protein OH76DRAFT_32390 [Lentinus brumalis]|uniref:Uncharacterized protein n=1 Tax=Lentinus brumalis TaxID=2498619 RepID=A0A371DXY5_9APHY|nr:hypothetical protein OH76DRAFT_32390 [Polyporus brumalis]